MLTFLLLVVVLGAKGIGVVTPTPFAVRLAAAA